MNDDGQTSVIGAPLDRTDGAQKMTGAARYAAEFRPANLCHGVMVVSTIPHGRVVNLDASRAQHAPGVLLVLTHRNVPKLPEQGRAAVKPPAGRVLSLLQDDVVHYNRQPIAVVVADTFEHATDAAATRPCELRRAACRHRFLGGARRCIQAQGGRQEAARTSRGAISRPASVRPRCASTSRARRPCRTTIPSSRTRPLPNGKAIA